MRIAIRRGLDLSLPGAPAQQLGDVPPVRHVGVLGVDYPGIRPSMAVKADQRVRAGDVLFTDRGEPRIRVTAPVAGTVTAINRGARRSLTSIVLRVGDTEPARFQIMHAHDLADHKAVAARLLESGLWPALRTRPYNQVPSPDARPDWLFITAIDTEPLAPDPNVVLADAADAFADGLNALRVLSGGPVFLCHAPGAKIPGGLPGITHVEFAGPHPAGLPGTHIHHLAAVNAERHAWVIDYQDVIAVGRLFRRGVVDPHRVIALAGDGVSRPRLVRALQGASIDELLRDEQCDGKQVLSGSVLSGRLASGPTSYVGRLHRQVTVRDVTVDHAPSGKGLSFARWWPGKRVAGRAQTHNSGLFATEAFERVWPMAAPPVLLLRALLAGDAETAEALGCLELAEDDLALCEYMCPANQSYRRVLRNTLDAIRAQG